MKLKAIRSFHTSGIGMVHERTEFEAHDALGKELVDKGLASVIEASTNATDHRSGEPDPSEGVGAHTDAGAAESAPHAKQEPAPLNKAALAPKTKRAAAKPMEE
jgi:hypothetical protein